MCEAAVAINECEDKNVGSMAINHLAAGVPRVGDKLEDVVDVVHRTGKRRADDSPRHIIIQFLTRLHYDGREPRAPSTIKRSLTRTDRNTDLCLYGGRRKTFSTESTRVDFKHVNYISEYMSLYFNLRFALFNRTGVVITFLFQTQE